MGFKKGDVVVCINDSDAGYSGIKINKKYVIDFDFDTMYFYLFPIKPDGTVDKMSYVFPKKRFVKISDIRKRKIENIRNGK